MVDVTGFSGVGIFSGVDLLGLSTRNFWYMGNLARDASGPSWVTGDTTTNANLGGQILLF